MKYSNDHADDGLNPDDFYTRISEGECHNCKLPDGSCGNCRKTKLEIKETINSLYGFSKMGYSVQDIQILDEDAEEEYNYFKHSFKVPQNNYSFVSGIKITDGVATTNVNSEDYVIYLKPFDKKVTVWDKIKNWFKEEMSYIL